MRLLSFSKQLRLDWIQVEVTTYCSGSCVYCPHTVYRDSWRNRHISMSTFKNILAGAGKTRLLFLQGWGEPFLNPEFATFVSLAKEVGYRVGTTTNGMYLGEREAIRLVNSGIDIIAFSVAGTTERQDPIRRGTSFSKVIDAIRHVNQAKREGGSDRPAIHIAYMLFPSTLDDLETLPDVFAGLGVSQIVISGLDFVATEALASETFARADEATQERARTCLDNVSEQGKKQGLDVHVQIPFFWESSQAREDNPEGRMTTTVDKFLFPETRQYACTENIDRALVVSADGSVSPCVFTNIPASEAGCVKEGTYRLYERLTFGNVDQEPLDVIWKKKEYSDFRSAFASNAPPSCCRGCPRRYTI